MELWGEGGGQYCRPVLKCTMLQVLINMFYIQIQYVVSFIKV